MRITENPLWSHIDSFQGNHSSPALTFYRPCPICESRNGSTFLQLDQFQFYSDSSSEPKRVDIRQVRCNDCGALYLNPGYSNHGFKILFSEAGQSYGSTLERPGEQIDWLKSRSLLNDGDVFLDVGCYDGGFLSALPDTMKRVGVDIDEPAIERGKQKYQGKKIEFIHGDFETFQYAGDLPGTITMFHVLEHLPRPVEVLKKLCSISGPTTSLVLEVPILENGKTNDINGFFSVQHMTHFSRSSLRKCLSMGGWEIKEEVQQPGYNGFRVVANIKKTPNDTPEHTIEPNDTATLNHYLSHWYKTLQEFEHSMLRFPASLNVVLWGGGAHTEFLYQTSSFFRTRRDVNFLIIDSDPIKHGKSWRGIKIYGPEVASQIDWLASMLVVSSYGGQESIVSMAQAKGISEDRVIRLYNEVNRY